MESSRSNVLDDYADLIRQKSFKDKEVLNLCENLGKSLRDNSNNQVRKFYDGLRTIARRGDRVDPYVQLTLYKSRVMYSSARRGGINSQFRDFLVKSLNVILAKEQKGMPKALQDFAEYFEAVYGYYYCYTPKENR